MEGQIFPKEPENRPAVVTCRSLVVAAIGAFRELEKEFSPKMVRAVVLAALLF